MRYPNPGNRKTAAMAAALTMVLLLAGCGGNRRIADTPVFDALAPGANTVSAQTSNSLTEAKSRAHENPLASYLSGWMGAPYRYGGTTHGGIDCSGLVLNAYRDLYGLQMPRRTRDQASVGKKVRKSRLTPGDLVFFKTGFRGRHVGIYLGDKRFAHSSESSGVRVSSLEEPYWSKRYWKASRVLK